MHLCPTNRCLILIPASCVGIFCCCKWLQAHKPHLRFSPSPEPSVERLRVKAYHWMRPPHANVSYFFSYTVIHFIPLIGWRAIICFNVFYQRHRNLLLPAPNLSMLRSAQKRRSTSLVFAFFSTFSVPWAPNPDLVHTISKTHPNPNILHFCTHFFSSLSLQIMCIPCVTEL